MLQEQDFHVFQIDEDIFMCLADGRIYIIDEIARDTLKHSNDNKKREILSAKYNETDIEKAQAEMDKILSIPIKNHCHDKPKRHTRALCLNITHACNLACSYCFAKNLTVENAPTMTPEVVRKSFDFLFRESQDVKRLQVDFFGGEPLLVFPLVKEAVEYARSLEKKFDKKVYFTLTTNATLLNDEIIDYLKENDITLILSLDGDKETNDKHRCFRNGNGTFDKIIENIKKVQAKLPPKMYYIRGTFTADSMNIKNTLEFYHRQGYYNVSLEPVAAKPEEPYHLSPAHLKEMLKNYKNAAKWLLDKPMQFFHFNLEMENPLCLTRRITGCGAGSEYLAVDPLGDLYACHQFIGFDEYKVGNVFDGKIESAIEKKMKDSTIYTKKECPQCWARFYCGGGCHFRHFMDSKDINTPSKIYCDLFKGRIETSLWFNVKKKEFIAVS